MDSSEKHADVYVPRPCMYNATSTNHSDSPSPCWCCSNLSPRYLRRPRPYFRFHHVVVVCSRAEPTLPPPLHFTCTRKRRFGFSLGYVSPPTQYTPAACGVRVSVEGRRCLFLFTAAASKKVRGGLGWQPNQHTFCKRNLPPFSLFLSSSLRPRPL